MTLDDLIERLEELRQQVSGEAEVRLMTQQTWPFENEIHGITTSGAIARVSEEEESDRPESGEIVYIVEGSQLGYGDKDAWNAWF